jgi:hypothetical protein
MAPEPDLVAAAEPWVADEVTISDLEDQAAPLAAAACEPTAETTPVVVAIEPPENGAARLSEPNELARLEASEPAAVEHPAASIRPVRPDTEALLANLLAIIRPSSAAHDTTEARPVDAALDPAEASAEPDETQASSEDPARGSAAALFEAGAIAQAETAVASSPMEAEYSPLVDEFSPVASMQGVEADGVAEPAATLSVADSGAQIESDRGFEPIADVPVETIEHLPFEHADIVDPGILSSDFVIVPADEPVVHPGQAEPDTPAIGHHEFAPTPTKDPLRLEEAADAPDVSRAFQDILPSEPAAAEIPAAPLPVTLPEMDVIAIDAGEDTFPPTAEPSASAPPPAPTAVEDRGPMAQLAFAPMPGPALREPTPPEMFNPAALAEPADIAPMPQPGQDAVFADAGETALSPPIAAVAVAPTQATTAAAMPAKMAESTAGSFGQTARASAPPASNDPMAPISWLSVEEKIALFS